MEPQGAFESYSLLQYISRTLIRNLQLTNIPVFQRATEEDSLILFCELLIFWAKWAQHLSCLPHFLIANNFQFLLQLIPIIRL